MIDIRWYIEREREIYQNVRDRNGWWSMWRRIYGWFPFLILHRHLQDDHHHTTTSTTRSGVEMMTRNDEMMIWWYMSGWGKENQRRESWFPVMIRFVLNGWILHPIHSSLSLFSSHFSWPIILLAFSPSITLMTWYDDAGYFATVLMMMTTIIIKKWWPFVRWFLDESDYNLRHDERKSLWSDEKICFSLKKEQVLFYSSLSDVCMNTGSIYTTQLHLLQPLYSRVMTIRSTLTQS